MVSGYDRLVRHCGLRSVYYHRSTARDNIRLKARIGKIAATRVHYGYRRVHVLLRREGFKDNHKRVYRLYRQQGLSLRYKRPKRNHGSQASATEDVGATCQSDVAHGLCGQQPV